YVFDPRASLKRYFLDPKNEFTLLIDEAHNLVERSREMFSAQIKKQPFLDMRRGLKNGLPHIHKSMGKINSWLVKARKRCSESGGFISEQEQPEQLYPYLKKFLKQTEEWLAKNIKTPYRDGLLELYFDVRRFMQVSEQYDESYATCLEKKGKELYIKLFCIDPSKHLARTLERCRACIFFSATMIPAEYFRKMLGCRESASILELPSPFPTENLRLLLYDRISTLYKDRERTKLDTAKAIVTFVRQKKGNYLLYFPSYEYMMMVYESFQEEWSEMETICQTPGMTEEERELFIKRFSKDNSQTLAGFAVMGGVFGEGIDLVGEKLSGAVIVGVGLPGISPERDVIRDYFSESDKAGFEYAYLYPGINRVFQALGRVIRTEIDRGAVLLIDSRFSTFRYRRLFPAHWQPVVLKDNQQMRSLLHEFWAVA
ncbi:MAG: ATP-dependent DNA helicase, partial [Desulfobacteraceae bacterium]|nr:ATP-dependent DNA helicase [Desulfobacteraceae bacterium]